MIVGAGLAGLIAAHVFPSMPIFEASPAPTESHKALLRFRSSSVGDLTGVEFRPVTVRKGIWSQGEFRQPDIRLANLYSQKVIGSLAPRSVWDINTVTRWVAPEDFYQRLVDAVASRICWGAQFKFMDAAHGTPVINTAPMPIVLRDLGIGVDAEFARAPIDVLRYRVHGADVHQTVYFPDADTSVYRASITGDLLIVELMPTCAFPHDGMSVVRDSLGIDRSQMQPIDRVTQRYGKVVALPDVTRRALLAKLTREHNIFSLGRFATWRNVLLDDVVKDCAVVKRLMTASEYERRLAAI